MSFSLPGASSGGAIVAEEWETILLSLILVMFAYGGWADLSFVAAEVRDPKAKYLAGTRLGTLSVTVIYLQSI